VTSFVGKFLAIHEATDGFDKRPDRVGVFAVEGIAVRIVAIYFCAIIFLRVLFRILFVFINVSKEIVSIWVMGIGLGKKTEDALLVRLHECVIYCSGLMWASPFQR
jgi:hypothetical protein